MQLRIARLCLDCEELFVGDSCPICASQRYAFLAQWLPSEERRKWRRAPVPVAVAPRGLARVVDAFQRVVARLFDEDPPPRRSGSPRTRRSDFVPAMKFDEPAQEQPSRRPHAPDPIKGDAR